MCDYVYVLIGGKIEKFLVNQNFENWLSELKPLTAMN